MTFSASMAQASSGERVEFTVSAREAQSHGALAFRISYGDGSGDQNVVPQFCLAGAGSAQSQTWPLTHTYTAPGAYRVSVAVTANCTPDTATASASITIS